MKNAATILFVTIILGASQQAYSLDGKFSATVLAVDVESCIVARWLPEGVCLKNRNHPTHKVILMMGTQKNVGYLKPYNEVIVVVPDVTYQGCTYMYFPKLYLDNRQAVAGGKLFFGFPKEKAWMKHCADQFQLCMDGTPLLTAKLNHKLDQPINRGENFAEMKRMLSQPMLLVQLQKVVCSSFNMKLDCECITNVDVEKLQICKGFMPCLPGLCTSVGNISVCPSGAFYIHSACWNVPRKATDCPACKGGCCDAGCASLTSTSGACGSQRNSGCATCPTSRRSCNVGGNSGCADKPSTGCCGSKCNSGCASCTSSRRSCNAANSGCADRSPTSGSGCADSPLTGSGCAASTSSRSSCNVGGNSGCPDKLSTGCCGSGCNSGCASCTSSRRSFQAGAKSDSGCADLK